MRQVDNAFEKQAVSQALKKERFFHFSNYHFLTTMCFSSAGKSYTTSPRLKEESFDCMKKKYELLMTCFTANLKMKNEKKNKVKIITIKKIYIYTIIEIYTTNTHTYFKHSFFSYSYTYETCH